MSMRKLVFTEHHWQSLQNQLLPHPPERFAFGLARPQKRGGQRIDYMVEHVVFADATDYMRQSSGGLALSQAAAARFNRISADAVKDGLVPLHIHSHPPGANDFSACDDAHESETSRWLRTQDQPLFLSLVLPCGGQPQARLWSDDATHPCALQAGLRPLGVASNDHENPALLRQAAFGHGLRQATNELHIGIVGLGGVGMAVIEPLVRAGFQNFTLVDFDRVEETNLNRLPSTHRRDIGRFKVNVASRLIAQAGRSVGSTTKVKVFTEDVYTASSRCKRALQACDVILALTDNHLSRIECLQLALESGVVFLQGGVEILLDEQPKRLLAEISGAELGRYCPICVGRLHPGQASLDARRYVGGEVWDHAQQNGYVPDVPAPSVMSINSMVAGTLVLELQRRISGLGSWDLWQCDFNNGSLHAIERINETMNGECYVCGRS
ncbi:ThiF family adenylyltransferase [Methylomonas sp. LWB]|uniref:ThiF family adenylyltransferase n=1 Tax=Methylomonas sp. LWB TaxID=1905845 RepID=UPI0009F623A7|nr:ThiF family adenylyltransferase [Methylomonas sp. LWB]